MKHYIGTTTTGDLWEICGSTYLISAKDKREAKKMLLAKCGDEKIETISEIKTDRKTPRIKMIQHSIVE